MSKVEATFIWLPPAFILTQIQQAFRGQGHVLANTQLVRDIPYTLYNQNIISSNSTSILYEEVCELLRIIQVAMYCKLKLMEVTHNIKQIYYSISLK